MEITNPSKVMFPDRGLTKADVVGYYASVADAMLPHLADRPLTLERYPNGIAEKGFMQKNASAHFPDFIDRAEMPKRDGVTLHPVVRDANGITYLANQGTISFHVTTTRAGAMMPDRIIFDLDPPEGAVEAARRATGAVGEMVTEVGLAGFPMASGSKGYHVVVPIAPTLSIAVVDEMARGMAELLADRHPDLLTTEFRIANRRGRVFVDWLRNRLSSTSIAPWSLRPLAGAPVAMPISWEELPSSMPGEWTLENATERLASPGPWDGFESAAIDPSPVAAAVWSAVEAAGIVIEPFDRFRS